MRVIFSKHPVSTGWRERNRGERAGLGGGSVTAEGKVGRGADMEGLYVTFENLDLFSCR